MGMPYVYLFSDLFCFPACKALEEEEAGESEATTKGRYQPGMVVSTRARETTKESRTGVASERCRILNCFPSFQTHIEEFACVHP